MSVAEQRLEGLLRDLERLSPDQVAQLFRQLLQPSQADFSQALRIFMLAALTTDKEVERLAGEPLRCTQNRTACCATSGSEPRRTPRCWTRTSSTPLLLASPLGPVG